MTYIEKMHETVNDALETHKRVSAQEAGLKADYEGGEIGSNAYKEKTLEARQERAEAVREAMDAIDLIAEEYAEAATKADAVSGEMINGDFKLLSAGFELTPAQFADMASRNAGNRLVLLQMREYAAQRPEKYDLSTLPAPLEERITAFGQFANNARNAVANPDSLASAFFVEGNCDPAICVE